GAGRLLLNAGQRAGEHSACTWPTARGREQIANERRAMNLELVAMWLCHGTLLPVGRTSDARDSDKEINEVTGLLFFQKGPRDLQVRVLLHVCRGGLADQHCVICLGLCPIAG